MIDKLNIKVQDSGQGYLVGQRGTASTPLNYLESNALVAFFDSPERLFEYVLKNYPEPRNAGSSDNRGTSGFNKFGSYDEAIDMFTKTPEQIVNFDETELRVKDTGEAGNSVDYQVTGDYIDMGRHMEGVPEQFGTMHRGNARNRRINIIFNISVVNYIKESDALHKAERILRLVDALENGGVRCSIRGIESSECTHTEVTVKHHHEPLTLTDLAIVTHPEFLRRILFRVIEYSETYESGYGFAYALTRAVNPKMLDDGDNSELNVFIDGNLQDKSEIDELFNGLERLLVWEMSKETPEIAAIKLDEGGIFFEAIGSSDDIEIIKREGKEIINGED